MSGYGLDTKKRNQCRRLVTQVSKFFNNPLRTYPEIMLSRICAQAM